MPRLRHGENRRLSDKQINTAKNCCKSTVRLRSTIIIIFFFEKIVKNHENSQKIGIFWVISFFDRFPNRLHQIWLRIWIQRKKVHQEMKKIRWRKVEFVYFLANKCIYGVRRDIGYFPNLNQKFWKFIDRVFRCLGTKWLETFFRKPLEPRLTGQNSRKIETTKIGQLSGFRLQYRKTDICIVFLTCLLGRSLILSRNRCLFKSAFHRAGP